MLLGERLNCFKKISIRVRLTCLREVFLASFLFFHLFTSQFALAARVGMVAVEQAEVLDAPSRSASTVETIPKGAPVGASNVPTDGFFKVRTPSGRVGWVHGSKLSLQEAPSLQDIERDFARLNLKLQDPAPDAPSQSSAQNSPDASGGSVEYRKYGKRTETPSDWNWSLGLRATGNINFYSIADVITDYSLGTGVGMGGTVLYRMGSVGSIAFRVESISKGYTLTDSNNVNYLVLASTLPVMGGLEFAIWRTSAIEVDIGFYGGLGMNTSIGIDTGSGDSEVSATVSGSAMTGLVTLGMQLRVSDAITLFAETGYRYLKSPEMQGDTADFPGFVNDTYIVDMSGPIFGAGIGIYF